MRPVSVMIVLTALLCVVVAVIAYFVTSSWSAAGSRS